jgi:uncharacterized protein (DUF927 family)
VFLPLGFKLKSEGENTVASHNLDEMLGTVPKDFAVTDDGVFYLKSASAPSEDDDFEADEVATSKEGLLVCSRLDILGTTSDEEGSNHGTLLRWWDPKGKVNLMAVPDRDWVNSGKQVIARLVDRGLRLSFHRKAPTLLRKYVVTAEPRHHFICTPRTGWVHDSFVFPDRVIGASNVVYQGPELSSPFRKAGTLEEWKTEVGSYCRNNSRLIFGVSAALAATTLELVSGDSGGVHLFGDTSCGKTTAAEVAASTALAPRLITSWHSTINGLEDIAEAHNHLFFPVDEIGQADPKQIGKAVYMLGNGTGKKRFRQASKRWQLLFFSTGEITLKQALESAGLDTKGGQAVRLLDIPADAGRGMGVFEDIHGFASPAAFADHLKASARKFHGTAAETFVQRIAEDKSDARIRMNETVGQFLRDTLPDSAPGDISRAARRFAIVAAAGEMAVEWGIAPWEPGEAIDAAKVCMEAWLNARGSLGSLDVDAGIRQVREFLALYGTSRFKFMSDRRSNAHDLETHFDGYVAPDRMLERAGYRKDTPKGTLYLVNPTMFRAEVCQGFDSKPIIEALIRRGHAIKDKEPGRLTLTHRTETGTEKFYAIYESLLREPDAANGNSGNAGNNPAVPGVTGVPTVTA